MALFTGNIRFTSTDDAQDDNKGNVYYDESESKLKHYDGSDWLRVNQTLNYDRPGDGPYDVDGYTTLLIHSNTSNGSTTFDDSGETDHAITASGNVQHKTAQSKIGATSMYFDGNDKLTIADHADLDLDGGDFTIDLWLNANDVSSPSLQSVFAKWRVDTIASYYLLIHPTAKLRWYLGNGTNTFTSVGSFTVEDGVWYHAALTKVGDVFTSYVNGVQDGSTVTFSSFGDNNLPVTVGGDDADSRPFYGYIDELRVSKGIARWTSNFTVYT